MNQSIIGGMPAKWTAGTPSVGKVPPLTFAALLLFAAPALAQMDPMEGAPATAAASRPAVKLIAPTVDVAKHEVRLPAAFWNQKLAGWIEMAVTGMESEFLHETIVAVPTNRAMLLDALHKAGFQDADAWTFSISDFPRVRGDRALILLEVTRNGKVETYSLNELLAIGGWNVSPGPLGWMFKGEPGLAPGREKSPMEDPEIALQNRGLQHLANSLLDLPLSYDNWMYPLPKYVRNYTLLPGEVYDSNGAVPVTMVIRKVTEEELLAQSAAVWHDRAASAEMLKLVPVAREIDQFKKQLLALVPALRKMQADAPNVALSETDEGQHAALLAADIHQRYAMLDATLIGYAARNADPRAIATKEDKTDPQADAEVKDQAKAFAAHLLNESRRTGYVAEMERVNARRRDIKKQGGPDGDLAKATGESLTARSQAQLVSTSEPLEYWTREKKRLDPNDPRADWVRQVAIELELATVQHQVAQTGVDLGKAIATGADRTSLQEAYQQQLEKEQLIKLQLELANFDFEISKREGFGDDPELPQLKKQRDALAQKIAALTPTTAPSSEPATR